MLKNGCLSGYFACDKMIKTVPFVLDGRFTRRQICCGRNLKRDACYLVPSLLDLTNQLTRGEREMGIGNGGKRRHTHFSHLLIHEARTSVKNHLCPAYLIYSKVP